MAQSRLPAPGPRGCRSGDHLTEQSESPPFSKAGFFVFPRAINNRRPDRNGRQGEKMKRLSVLPVTLVLLAALLPSCSPRIYGRLELVDAALRPVSTDNAAGTVVNMMNTTAPLEKASHAAVVDGKGEFTSAKDAIVKGMYKVEAARIGYVTETQTVEIGRFSRKKLEIRLKKIDEGTRKAIEGTATDQDKIINPGEVNIQAPSM